MVDAKKVTSEITHVIFDLDGLLIDSETIYTEVNTKLLRSYGRQFTMEMKTHMMGMRRNDAIKWLLSQVSLTDQVSTDYYNDQYESLLMEALPNSKLMPGALKLVRHLATHGIPIALCTGSDSVEFSAKMRNHKELLSFFSVQVLIGDDLSIKRGKPAPDGFLATLNRFPKKPDSTTNVLVFEDSINGVQAAIAAGMNVIMVPTLSYTQPPNEDKIIFVLKTLEDFRPESVGLPSYEDYY